MILIIVLNDFIAELFRQLEIQSSSKMNSDAFAEDSDGAEVRQMRLANSDDSSEDEEPDRFMTDPNRFINIEVLIMVE